MNIKKIGLTALAGSLVVTSAYAGSMSVSGGASIGLKNTSKTATGKSWTMGNQITFSGSGELDNGMNVALSMVIDQNDDSTLATAAQLDNSPFDSHSVTISSDSLGTLVFSGEGGSSAQSAIDTTAAGDLWNNGSNVTAPRASEAGDNSLFYTLPSIMDDLTVTASMSPGGAGGSTATAYALTYTGVEGLSVSYGAGETNTVGTEQDHTTMKASYAWGSFTIGASTTESAYDNAASIDETVDSWQVAYTVSDDMSVTYGVDTIETEAQAVDEEISGIGISYTTGGVTITANRFEATGQGNSNTETATTGDGERWTLGASFAF
jgi:outer membrane protein OmpU